MTYWLDGNLKTQTSTDATATLDMELEYYYGSEQNHYTPVLTLIIDDHSGGVTYETTEAGRLTGAILHVGYDDVAEAQLKYTAQGWLETVTLTDEDLLGQIVTTFDHDDAGRVTGITHEHDDFNTVTSLSEFTYTWDDGNRIESYSGPEGDRDYVYDKTNQILEVSAPGVGVLEEFDYDANGNRDTGYTTGTGNRLTNDGTWEYTYDNEGNVIQKTDGVTVWDYYWDHRNRLVHVKHHHSESEAVYYEAWYTYDVFNRRIRVQEDTDGNETIDADRWTAYDGANAYADFDANGDMTTRYLNGRAMDQRFARYDVGTDETAFYLPDLVNSVRQIVDAEGTVLYAANYTAFGMTGGQTGAGGDRFKYTGREMDGTGDYYYRARYFGAGVGRFLSEDPIGFAAGDPNLYRYVGNGPLFRQDTSGLFWDWGGAWGGLILGGESGAITGGVGGAVGGAILGPAAAVTGGVGAVGGGIFGGIGGFFAGGFGWGVKGVAAVGAICGCLFSLAAPSIATAAGLGGAAGGGGAGGGSAAVHVYLTAAQRISLQNEAALLRRSIEAANAAKNCEVVRKLNERLIAILRLLGD